MLIIYRIEVLVFEIYCVDFRWGVGYSNGMGVKMIGCIISLGLGGVL